MRKRDIRTKPESGPKQELVCHILSERKKTKRKKIS
jgi:hypothetical protein